MHIGDYIWKRAGAMLLCAAMLIFSAGYLWLTGTDTEALIWVAAVWVCALTGYLAQDYVRKKRRWTQTEKMMSQLKEKYLYTELMPAPENEMERMYFECSRRAGKAMLERIDEAERGSREYREYIESWIHEVKNPLLALDLYCQNHLSGDTKAVQREVRKISGLVEQALYYARSGSVEKDYFVQEFQIADALVPAMQNWRGVILQKRISVETGDLEERVYTDPKWLSFVLDQLLSNAVKYISGEGGLIRIRTEKEAGGVWLWIEDNGCGIPAEDISRVCERGFTGANRTKKTATGMGLYLVDTLCRKLGLTFTIRSQQGVGTQAGIRFPIGKYTEPARQR